MGILRLGKV